MAASEGDHRVHKSPAAAQRPPHLKALEVFSLVFGIFFDALWHVSLTVGAFFALGFNLLWKHVEATPSPSKAFNFGVFHRQLWKLRWSEPVFFSFLMIFWRILILLSFVWEIYTSWFLVQEGVFLNSSFVFVLWDVISRSLFKFQIVIVLIQY